MTARKPAHGEESWDAILGTDGSTTGFLDVSLNEDGTLKNTVTTQSGTTYTFVLADAETIVEFTSGSAVTVTVPPNSSVAFNAGTCIEILQYGAGTVTVAAGVGVTVRSPSGMLDLNGQYSAAVLRKRATNEWMLEGDLA